MKDQTLFIFAICFLLGSFSGSRAYEWPKIPESDWQQAENPEISLNDAVYLFESGVLKEREKDYFYEYYARVKVLTESGKDIGTWSIIYDDEDTEIVEIQGRVHKPDRNFVPLTENDIFIENVYKKGEQEEMAKKVIFPGIETGCIIEIYFAKKVNVPVLRWTFQNRFYTLKSRYSYKPKDLLFDWRLLNDNWNYPIVEFLPNRKEMEEIVFTLKNIAPFVPEENMPPEEDFKTTLVISLVRPTIFRFFSNRKFSYYYLPPASYGLATYYFDADQYWSKRAIYFGEFFNYLYQDSSSLEKIVESTILPSDNKATRMKKLYDYVQQNFLVHKYLPKEKRRKDEEVQIGFRKMIDEKYGSSWSLNMLYAGLLRKAGIKASIIKVQDRDEGIFNKDILSDNFNRFLTMADTARNKFVFLSPGTPRLPYACLPWYNQNVVGLLANYFQDRFSVFNKSLFETSEDDSPANNLTFSEATITIEPDYSALLQVQIHLKGQADFTFKQKYLNHSDEEILKEYKKGFQTRWPEMELVNFSVANRDSTYAFTGINYEIRIPDFATPVGKRLLLKPVVFKKPFSRINQIGERKYPYVFNYIFKNYTKIRVIPPENMTLEVIPPAIQVKNRVGMVLSEFVLNANQIEVNTMVSMNQREIEPRYFEQVQSLALELEKIFDQEIVLVPAVTAQK